MKIVFNITFCFFVFFSHSQTIFFPDPNFKAKLLQSSTSNAIALDKNSYPIQIDSNNDGQIQQSEALFVENLQVQFSSITSLTGIEYFTNIKYLKIHFNSLVSIDISALTQLIFLRCDVNNLASLNLNGLINIEELQINNNNISTIDFSALPNLKSLKCNQNQFTIIDLSNNILFNQLICANNNLTLINLKNNINHDFSNVNFNDCWKTGNPNLATICVDASELASVQNHLNNCGSAQTINISSNCGLGSEEFAANKVVLYPNPTNNFVTLHNEEGFFTTVVIYNYLGQKLKQLSIVDEMTIIDLSNFNNGIYFFNLLGEKNEVVKIVKQ